MQQQNTETTTSNNSNNSEIFLTHMTQFYEQAKAQIDTLLAMDNEKNAHFDRTTHLFAEDTQQCSYYEFFANIMGFVNAWKKIRLELAQEREIKKRVFNRQLFKKST